MGKEAVAQLMATNEKMMAELARATEKIRNLEQSYIGHGESMISHGGYGRNNY